MIDSHDNLLKELEAVQGIPIVPTLLEVICEITGMGFAAIARVTQDRWLACSVRDEVQFGLKEGEELKIDTTICNEIRNHHQPVIIDHVDRDDQYKDHPTPKMYGLQSYISFPIILKNGQFFGTICAIDPNPAQINNKKVLGTFKAFAELLSFHLQSLDLMEQSQLAYIDLSDKNKVLTKINNELDNFVYTVSHDLKAPIANIEGLLHALSSGEASGLSMNQPVIEMMFHSIERFKNTINDLTEISKLQLINQEDLQEIDVADLINEVQLDIREMLDSFDPVLLMDIEIKEIRYSRKNLRSIIYNLLSNALKYSSPLRRPEIIVRVNGEGGYIVLEVSDNGLGLSEDNQSKIFDIFTRVHDHVQGSGLGLYIVKRMIENHGGKIEVESEVDKGTTFRVYFLNKE